MYYNLYYIATCIGMKLQVKFWGFFFFACMHGEVQIYVIIICIFFLDIPIAACCTYNYNNTL